MFFRSEVMQQFINRLVSDESGATAIEYGLIAALIAIAAIAAMQKIGTGLNEKFQNVATNLGQK